MKEKKSWSVCGCNAPIKKLKTNYRICYYCSECSSEYNKSEYDKMKREQIKSFMDNFPEVVRAIEEYAHSEGLVEIPKYLRNTILQIINFCETQKDK